ncbi:hypothetical protein M9Y10_012000 [Tritrichomonas musculus]|uniref:Uncharacterized protein n=1 Tax=Tritrichomonas musculus TaxID=1915356 RepID=A0ABR2IBZ8_9EUKA
MKLFELDSHPLIENFRKTAGNLANDPGILYHFLLPPEYTIPEEISDPILYLFLESAGNNIWIQFGDEKLQILRKGNMLVPSSGFNEDFKIEILQTTPCTTTNGFSFDMHELTNNPFRPSVPIPPLCDDIKNAFEHPKNSLTFLENKIRSDELPRVINDLKLLTRKSIDVENKEYIVSKMHEIMDQMSDIIFEVKPFHYIPTIYKMRTNFIIFYAVTSPFHPKLLEVYHKMLDKNNSDAKKAIMLEKDHSVGNQEILRKAAGFISKLYKMPTVSDGIRMVTEFFEQVLSSLPDKNAAADDILPAVCDGLKFCSGEMSEKIVSTFQYLSDIWSMEGLDEKTTYIIVTCSIASTHFSSAEKNMPNISKWQRTIEVDRKLEGDSIEMIEKFLQELNSK